MNFFIQAEGSNSNTENETDCIDDNECHVSPQKIKIKVIPTEIYSRVVGYYRPTMTWNKGKMEEWVERKMLKMGDAVGGEPHRP